MDDQIKQIAERLRGLRDVLELTAEDIARDCEISAEEYRLAETGDYDISVSMLQKSHRQIAVARSGRLPRRAHTAEPGKRNRPESEQIGIKAVAKPFFIGIFAFGKVTRPGSCPAIRTPLFDGKKSRTNQRHDRNGHFRTARVLSLAACDRRNHSVRRNDARLQSSR